VAQKTSRIDIEDLVHEYYARVDADDIDGMIRLFEPEAVYYRPGSEPLVGRAALESFYHSQPPIQSRRHILAGLINDGSEVAVHGTAHRIALDGQHSTIGFADFFNVSESGLFSRRRTFFFLPFA
jgi:steroid delta-isomerase